MTVVDTTTCGDEANLKLESGKHPLVRTKATSEHSSGCSLAPRLPDGFSEVLANGSGWVVLFGFDSRLLLLQTCYTNYSLISYYANK